MTDDQTTFARRAGVSAEGSPVSSLYDVLGPHQGATITYEPEFGMIEGTTARKRFVCGCGDAWLLDTADEEHMGEVWKHLRDSGLIRFYGQATFEDALGHDPGVRYDLEAAP